MNANRSNASYVCRAVNQKAGCFGERGFGKAPARASKTGQAMARRARIVLAATAGPGNKGDLRRGRRGREHGGKWRRRFAEHRLNGMLEVPRPGTPPQDRR